MWIPFLVEINFNFVVYLNKLCTHSKQRPFAALCVCIYSYETHSNQLCIFISYNFLVMCVRAYVSVCMSNV